MNDFDRGEDAYIVVTLQDSDSVDLDTAQFDDIIVKVTHKHLGTELARFSLQDSTVTAGSPTTDGEIMFTVLGSVTASAALGSYEYQIKTRDVDGTPIYRKFRGDCFYLKKALT